MARGLYPFLKRRAIYKSLYRSRRVFRRRNRSSTRRLRMFRMMARRRQKPELKYDQDIYSPGAGGTINASSRWKGQLTPATMPQGTGMGERVGNYIKMLNNQFRVNMITLGTNGATGINGYLRILIFSCRVAWAQAEPHIDLMEFNEPMDYNVATVHHDKYIRLGYDQWEPADDTAKVATATPTLKHFQFYTKFPRKVHFANGSNTIDINTDTLHIAIFNNSPYNVRFAGFRRTTYIDV